MRAQLKKLNKFASTKTERKFSEILKKNRIEFRFKQRIGKYEVDFKIGKLIVELDGEVHKGIKTERDVYLLQKGYVPVHLKNNEVWNNSDKLEEEVLYLIKANLNL